MGFSHLKKVNTSWEIFQLIVQLEPDILSFCVTKDKECFLVSNNETWSKEIFEIDSDIYNLLEQLEKSIFLQGIF